MDTKKHEPHIGPAHPPADEGGGPVNPAKAKKEMKAEHEAAKKESDKTHKDLEGAQKKVDKAKEDLAKATEELAEARKERDKAQTAHQDAAAKARVHEKIVPVPSEKAGAAGPATAHTSDGERVV